MRKTLYILLLISFLLKGCMEDAEMTPRYYPLVSAEVKTDSLSNSVTFYGKIEEGVDSIVEYGFVYTLKKGIYLPGNFITFEETGYKNFSLTLNSGLLPDTVYKVRTWAKTKRFTVLGAAVDLHTHNYEPKVKDIDGNPYHTVVIGKQEWMVENLRVTRYTNGDSLPSFEEMDPDSDTGTGAYGIYHPEVVEIYGMLYNWYAVDDSRGLCPPGWRIPSDEDWIQLEGLSDSQFGPDHPEWLKHGSRGADAGYHLRSTVHWSSYPVYRGRNHFGLRVLPGGIYDANNAHNYTSERSAFIWTHTTYSTNDALYRLFERNSKAIHREAGSKESGMSVRCMRDVVFEPDFH